MKIVGGNRGEPVAQRSEMLGTDGNNVVLIAVNRGGSKDITLHNNNLGLAPGTYRGVIADASTANANNYVRVDHRSAVIHLEAISSIVLPN